MPGKKKGLDLAKNKAQIISDKLDAFQALISQAAGLLSDDVIRDFLDKLNIDAGIITNDQDNIKKILLIDKAFEAFKKTEGVNIATVFAKDIKEILQLGKEYYIEVFGKADQTKDIEGIITRQLGITDAGTPKPNGFLDNLVNDTTVQTELKQTVFKQITGNRSGYNDLKNTIEQTIKGTGEDPGKYYQHYNRFAFDTYSQVDRLNSVKHAERLDLKYFLYNGGVVKDSRAFCIERHGHAFTTKEAEEWIKLVNKIEMRPGKRKALIKVPVGPIVDDLMVSTYDPLTDMGGIQCRHSPDFISQETYDYIKSLGAK